MVTNEQLKKIQEDFAGISDTVATVGTNDFYGLKTKRAYSILKYTRSIDCLLTNPRLSTMVEALLAPNALLSTTNYVEILPGERAQKLHYDQQFGNIGAETRGTDYTINFMFAVDDFTEENGATIIIPGSHLWPVNRLPLPTDVRSCAAMKAGSVCMFSGNLWHSGGSNNTQKTRRGVISVFIQPWLRAIENHFLAVPFPIAAALPVQIQSYLGYSLHHPFVGHVNFMHPRKKLMELAKL